MQIETITCCNRRCYYCPNSLFDRSLEKNSQLMDEKLYKKIIDDLKDIGFCGWIRPHRYNEPILDKRMCDFVRYTKSQLGQDIKFEIVTNGDLLDVAMYLALVKAGIDSFLVTLHPPLMTKNLQETLDYREKYGDHNVELKIEKIAHFSSRGGLIKLKDMKPKGKCSIPTHYLIIDHQGHIPLCPNDYFVKNILGNVSNKSILDIWNDLAYKKVRQQLRRGEPAFDICKECSYSEKAEIDEGMWEENRGQVSIFDI